MKDLQAILLKELVIYRPDLVQAIKAGQDEGTVTSQVKKDDKGNMVQWVEERKDINGMLVSKRVDDYVYYSNGCIDTIVQQKQDKDKLVSKKTIKHFEGKGKQPIVTVEDFKK